MCLLHILTSVPIFMEIIPRNSSMTCISYRFLRRLEGMLVAQDLELIAFSCKTFLRRQWSVLWVYFYFMEDVCVNVSSLWLVEDDWVDFAPFTTVLIIQNGSILTISVALFMRGPDQLQLCLKYFIFFEFSNAFFIFSIPSSLNPLWLFSLLSHCSCSSSQLTEHFLSTLTVFKFSIYVCLSLAFAFVE